MSLPSPISILIAGAIALAGAVACFGSPPALPAVKKSLHASPQVKGATVTMQSAKASLVASLPKYMQLQFVCDPNNGKTGYVNWITTLQGSVDYGKSWSDLGSVSGQTNGFAVRFTNRFEWYRFKAGIQ